MDWTICNIRIGHKCSPSILLLTCFTYLADIFCFLYFFLRRKPIFCFIFFSWIKSKSFTKVISLRIYWNILNLILNNILRHPYYLILLRSEQLHNMTSSTSNSTKLPMVSFLILFQRSMVFSFEEIQVSFLLLFRFLLKVI